jgi:GH18 family chitinase
MPYFPSCNWILRGEENLSGLKYLDYANLMSYDLHGGWNQYVGPNAPLFDDGNDAELKAGRAYQFANIGYLNVDWAYRYYRGALQAGRINLGPGKGHRAGLSVRLRRDRHRAHRHLPGQLQRDDGGAMVGLK